MNDILNVCNYIVEYEAAHNRAVSNLRLQKLLYFLQASYILNSGEACFDSEIQAWQYGPVIPKAYSQFSFFGSIGIRLQEKHDLEELIPSKDERTLINSFLDNASLKNTTELVDISHKQAPWKDAYKPGEKTVITIESIRSYFSKQDESNESK